MSGCKGHVGACVENNFQEPVTYGGPIVDFRWDNMVSMQFKWLSIREISPPTGYGYTEAEAENDYLYQGPEGYIFASKYNIPNWQSYDGYLGYI